MAGKWYGELEVGQVFRHDLLDRVGLRPGLKVAIDPGALAAR